MDLWYSRQESAGAEFRIKVKRPLFAGERGGTRIDVLESEDFGKLLLVDGKILLAEGDADAAGEMTVHPAMGTHPSPRSVLVAGGGDGFVLRELLRYPELERVVVVEPEAGILEAAKRWFPEAAAAFDDPRASVAQEGAAEYVRASRERFDLIVIAQPEPEGGEGALGQAFYCDCFRVLAGDGLLVHRLGSAYFPGRQRDFLRLAGKVKRLFPLYRPYRVELPSIALGGSYLGIASKRWDPKADFDAARWSARGLRTRSFSPATHAAAFALSPAVEELLAQI